MWAKRPGWFESRPVAEQEQLLAWWQVYHDRTGDTPTPPQPPAQKGRR